MRLRGRCELSGPPSGTLRMPKILHRRFDIDAAIVFADILVVPHAMGLDSELDIQLAEIDGRLSYIDDDKAVITKSLAELQESILATPANEVVLNALERNYKNTQIQYDTAVAKLAEASTQIE